MRPFASIAGAIAILLSGPAIVCGATSDPNKNSVLTEVATNTVKGRTDKRSDASLSAAVGQMIIVGFEGSSPEDARFRKLKEKARLGQISGVLYLQRNIASRASVKAMNAALQDAASQPLIIAVDQEGGAIQRIPSGMAFPRIPSAKTIASKLTLQKAYQAYSVLARNLQSGGFNLNLGPVADLNVNPAYPIIGKLGRSFSGKPETVVHYAAAFVDAHRKFGVLTSLKHFPGHGSARTDSHDGFSDVSDTSTPEELSVFRDLIEDDYADLVMVGHTYDAKLQPNGKRPATLDRDVVTKLLRKKMRYDGAVMTDDLQMAAVTDHFSLRDTVIDAVLAGNDLLVFGNSKSVDPEIDVKVAAILTTEAKQNPKIRHLIELAAFRIATLKRKLGEGVDDISTRSIADGLVYLTPSQVDSQARPPILIPVF